MCGRYFFNLDGNDKQLQELRSKIEQLQLDGFKMDEVFPSEKALVLVSNHDSNQPCIKTWGMKGFKNNLLINARLEGIEEKRTFSPYLHQRCLIPCNGFYEWIKEGSSKTKIYVTKKKKPLIYLAGIYNEHDEFVIMTGASLHKMKDIHERTPLIISEDNVQAYFDNTIEPYVDNDHLQFTYLKKG